MSRLAFYEDDWEDHNEHDWDARPANLWDDVTRGEGWEDEYGKMLFDMVFIDPETADVRASAFDMLKDWFADEYGIDFEANFDWEAWREWYG